MNLYLTNLSNKILHCQTHNTISSDILKVVQQQQDKMKREEVKADRHGDTQTVETDNQITRMSSVSNSPIESSSKQQLSTNKCWSESTSIPKTKSSNSPLPSRIISKERAM